jgi:osmoprotectant transport system ATP-binding protein
VDGRPILNGLSFEVDRGETLVLLGRSGSGKTTALRLINLLLTPTSGTIHIGEENILLQDPIQLRRKIGYVIQDFGLLPHWTVQQNVSLVPRLLHWPAEKQAARAKELLQQTGLDDPTIGARFPHQLSGGQRQRVGVARALAAEPGLLLFDEPFGALDPITRHEMQQQFLQLRQHYHVASVFVTHDLLEALAIGTRIAVLNQGNLECLLTPDEFLQAQSPVARSFLATLPAALMKDAGVQ